MRTELQFKNKSLRVFLCISLLLSVTTMALADEYQYINVPAPWRWSRIDPSGINNKGVVFGNVALEIAVYPIRIVDKHKGFFYNGWLYIELLPPGCTDAYAVDMNESSVVVGTGWSDRTDTGFGFIYNDGVYTKLLPPGWNSAGAYDINDSGAVLGWGNDGTGTTKGFIYSDGTYTELLPPGYTYAAPSGINENGVVVGLGYYKSACQWYNRGEVFIALPK
jgi:probable HAF family extracellular repeat protein